MSSPVQDLLKLLDLEQLELNLFRGYSPQTGWQRVYGGQVIGQALVAAMPHLEAAARPPHSLHAYFLLAGDPTVPIIYEVERVRDGKSFATRRVKASSMARRSSSCRSRSRDEPGMTHQAEMPKVPTPEELPTLADLKRAAADARAGAAVLRARAADRASAGRVRPLSWGARSRTAASTSGCVRADGCRMICPFTNVFWRTPPTWGCSTPRW